METLLKGFNTIYCVKLKKKSVSPVLGNKASPFLPTSGQGVRDANCGPVGDLTQQATELSGRAFWR